MSLKAKIKGIKSGRRELRSFGFTVGGALCVVGLLLFVKNHGWYRYFTAAGLALIIAGWLSPIILKPLQKVWMAVSIIIGLFITTLILILLFFLVITPMGILARLSGRKVVTKGFEKSAETYWIRRIPGTQDRSRCEKQY